MESTELEDCEPAEDPPKSEVMDTVNPVLNETNGHVKSEFKVEKEELENEKVEVDMMAVKSESEIIEPKVEPEAKVSKDDMETVEKSKTVEEFLPNGDIHSDIGIGNGMKDVNGRIESKATEQTADKNKPGSEMSHISGKMPASLQADEQMDNFKKPENCLERIVNGDVRENGISLVNELESRKAIGSPCLRKDPIGDGLASPIVNFVKEQITGLSERSAPSTPISFSTPKHSTPNSGPAKLKSPLAHSPSTFRSIDSILSPDNKQSTKTSPQQGTPTLTTPTISPEHAVKTLANRTNQGSWFTILPRMPCDESSITRSHKQKMLSRMSPARLSELQSPSPYLPGGISLPGTPGFMSRNQSMASLASLDSTMSTSLNSFIKQEPGWESMFHMLPISSSLQQQLNELKQAEAKPIPLREYIKQKMSF